MASSPSSPSTGPLTRLRQFLSFLRPMSPPTASAMKSVHFGGGNIGRGFVAEFLHKSGYEVVFVDVMDDLITKLQEAKSYNVIEMGLEGNKTTVIDNFRAINSKTDLDKVIQEIATADIVTCAVGPNILKFIAEPIAKGIQARTFEKPLAVIACENAIGATDTLRQLIEDYTQSKIEGQDTAQKLSKNARFANSAIDRIVPKQDPDAGLNVKIEKFYEWCVEQGPFEGNAPKIEGVHYVDDLEPYIERKLYTVNTAHATAAYYGYNRGKQYIHEALQDPALRDIVQKTLDETAKLIVDKHQISPKDQSEYVASIIKRISAEFFGDDVTRVGRAPIRKLGLKERFIGPARQLSQRGNEHSHLLGGVEMALRFQNVEGDDESFELAKILKEKSAEDAVKQLTGLTKEEYPQLYDEVIEIVQKVQKDTA